MDTVAGASDSRPPLQSRLWSMVRNNWHLGITAFGGPPVHFKIFHDLYVKDLKWLDEQVYQELFSVSQALSGPASTKMHYCINLLHNGFIPAFLGFFIWSLPGALGMFGLSIGISSISETLPRQVYALLSGLNAATVGTIVLAAVELSRKAITDPLTRIIVFGVASAGMLYNAIWYFPVLMLIAGLAAVVHDYRWLHGPVNAVIGLVKRKPQGEGDHQRAEEVVQQEREIESTASSASAGLSAVSVSKRRVASSPGPSNRPPLASSASRIGTRQTLTPPPDTTGGTDGTDGTDGDTRSGLHEDDDIRVVPPERNLRMSWKTGVGIIAAFLASFIVIMVLRGTLPNPSLLFSLFANMFLAGTIIFGGGPVVIPLLREYVVAEGWVSPRDFLIGLALIQAWPGPNFNFAVYLGSLTALNGGYNSAAGAVLAFVGIFAPGMTLCHGTMGIWSAIRGLRFVKSMLRGVNAGAVGLIYTAVYRLWQIGYIDEGYRSGTHLAVDPWWVVVTAASYVGGMWFGVKPPAAIMMGAIMGLIWYGVVSS